MAVHKSSINHFYDSPVADHSPEIACCDGSWLRWYEAGSCQGSKRKAIGLTVVIHNASLLPQWVHPKLLGVFSSVCCGHDSADKRAKVFAPGVDGWFCCRVCSVA